MNQQRLRVRFRKGERVRYISHLDVLRYWERCLRRAELPLAYSQGFTPHPRLQFAGPLPLGFVSDAEIVDVTLTERIDLETFERELGAQTTADLALITVEEVPVAAPSPQTLVTWATYEVDLPEVALETAAGASRDFLALDRLEWTEERKEKLRTYDLRAGVGALTAGAGPEGTRLTMQLSAHQDATTRPEPVVAAIFGQTSVTLIRRTELWLDEPSPARDAWRRRGQFEA